ncbi:MAG: HIT family protein [Prevotellaceae bacterium]|jgi:histidine triad (HIT) family protein|nr:HIT family protein [Prevotellaceae bacterium]
MPTIFSRIVAGELPCYKIAEDDKHFAFLDINPVNAGHTLVIPKREVDYIFDLAPDELADLSVFAQRIAKALKAALPCKRIALITLGLEVPHTHIHLIPIDKESDADFMKPKLKFSKEEFEELAEKIRRQWTILEG